MPPREKPPNESPGAQTRAADFESHATKVAPRKSIRREEDGGPQEETGAKGSKAEIPAGKEDRSEEGRGAAVALLRRRRRLPFRCSTT